jgi:pyrroline-5-carboxylate reductase
MTPLLMLGAGRMGGALVDGWRAAGVFPPSELIIRDPYPGAAAEAAAKAGARLNPPDVALAEARTVLVCVKPQIWKAVAAEVEPFLAADAVIVSIAAGVKTADLSQALGGRRTARIMPTTAVAIRQGVASIYAADAEAKARARALFEPVAQVVELADEELMHAATAVSGSSPAYLYAFIEALEAAGLEAGLDAEASRILARGTITGAAALLAQSGEDPAELRKQVTSPGGTTEAALKVLMGEAGFPALLREAVDAAARRSKELGG